MLAIAYLLGRWYFLEQLNTQQPQIKNSEILIILLLISGVVGAKLMYLLKHPDHGHLLFSGTGFSSQGALLGAILSTYIFTRIEKIKLHTIFDSAAPAAILAYAIARVGCFLSGDDCYGIPTDTPWAMSFPNGIKPTQDLVHPVPLYEIGYSVAIFVILNYRKNFKLRAYEQFFLLATMWGFCRFAVEFVSANERLILGMSGSQFGGLIMFFAGISFFAFRDRFESLSK